MSSLIPFLLLAAGLGVHCVPDDHQTKKGEQAPKAGM
jgi:hypothetical protein